MPINTIKVDVAVIGAGTAGLSAYRAARASGKRVLLIEGGPYGTTCARVGCMPSKLLIAAAEAAHVVSVASAFGIEPGGIRIDGPAVMARVRSERDRFVKFVVDGMEKIPQTDRLLGTARFVGPHQLQVDEHTLVEAERIVIATGSSARVPPELLGAAERLLISDDVFAWDDLPSSIAVIGSGIIGLELAQALHRLGVRVTIFGRGNGIAQLSDPAVLETASRCLAGELDLRLASEVLSVQRDGAEVVLRSRTAEGAPQSERYAYLLVAAGRTPNLEKLDLARAQIGLDQRGIPVFDPHTMQCGDSTIFIAGDADHERPLLHEAADQGHIAGRNAAHYPDVAPGLRRAPLAIVFSDPQIALVGQSFKTLNAHHAGTFAIGEVSFENQGRSRMMLQNRGLLRLYAQYSSGCLLGAEMIGPRVEHLAHLLAWACQTKMTVPQMLEMPFYHPVVEEGLRTALKDVRGKLAQSENRGVC